jgi:hypothetical protein
VSGFSTNSVNLSFFNSLTVRDVSSGRNILFFNLVSVLGMFDQGHPGRMVPLSRRLMSSQHS